MNIFWLLLPTISDHKKLQSLDRPEPGGEWSVESLTPANTRHCVMLSRDIPEIPDTGPTSFWLSAPLTLQNSVLERAGRDGQENRLLGPAVGKPALYSRTGPVYTHTTWTTTQFGSRAPRGRSLLKWNTTLWRCSKSFKLKKLTNCCANIDLSDSEES